VRADNRARRSVRMRGRRSSNSSPTPRRRARPAIPLRCSRAGRRPGLTGVCP